VFYNNRKKENKMNIQPAKWYIILDAYGEAYLDEDVLNKRNYFNTKAAALSWAQGTRCSNEGTRKAGSGKYEFCGGDLILTGEALMLSGYNL